MLGVDRNAYKLFADFRVNVIATAIKEINANPDLSILKVDYLKTGRKVSHMVFSCERAKQIQIPLDSEQLRLGTPKVEHADYIKELMGMGIDEQVAYRWKRKYTVARLRDAIAYTKAMQKEGKIRESVSGFLVHALTNNIGTHWAQEKQKKIQTRLEYERIEIAEQDASEQKRIASQQRTKNLLDAFHGLPRSEQVIIRGLFEAQMNEFLLGYWRHAKQSNRQPETEIKFSGKFAAFYEAYQETLGATATLESA